jgi:starch synthase (maltosyl-transferring)
MTQGPRIYNLFPLLAGPLPRWGPHLERAARMGFTWLFVNPFHQAGYSGSLYSVKDYYAIDARLLEGGSPPLEQLRGMLARAAALDLRLMMDLVVNHTAFDAPLIQQHPTWFKRDKRGEIVHPGAKDGEERVLWRDLAEVDNEGSPDRETLWAYWRELALYYADLGFRGFRCDAAYQVPGDLWRDLMAAVKRRCPDALFFAETLGCTPAQTLATARAGFDFIFNSSKWWDFREPWCLEQYAETSPVVPSVSFPESHDTPRLAAELDGDRDAVLQRYAFAAVFSTGVMMPIGFEYGFSRPLHVVRTTPADWETPRWDLSQAIAAVNRTKAGHPVLNQEGPITPLALAQETSVGFLKQARDGGESVLILLNLDRTAPARVRLPRGIFPAGPLALTDPVTGLSGLLKGDEEIPLGPSGIRIVHDTRRLPPASGAGPGAALPQPGLRRLPDDLGQAPDEEESAVTSKPRILIVDDDPEMRALLLDVLTKEGYETAEAKDGTEAVLALRRREFDVIVMDKNMPGPSGLDLLPGFRRVCPGTQVIMMTAFGDVPSYMEAVEKGAVEYLFKPFRMEEMKGAVAKALEKRAETRS